MIKMLSKFRGKELQVRCYNQKEAEKFLKYLHDNGYVWNNDRPCTAFTAFERDPIIYHTSMPGRKRVMHRSGTGGYTTIDFHDFFHDDIY